MKYISIFVFGFLVGYLLMPVKEHQVIQTKIIYQEKKVYQKMKPHQVVVTLDVPYLVGQKQDNQLMQVTGLATVN